MSAASVEPPQAGHSPSASGSGPAHSTQAPAPFTQELGRGARPGKRLVERGGRRKPVFRRRRRRMGHHVVEPGRDARARRAAVGILRAEGVGGRCGEVRVGKIAGERVVQREAQRVDVGARVAAAAGQHLGRRVGQRAGERAAAGDAELPVELGGPEVGEARAAVGIEQDVLRLDVAVEDAAPVRRRERPGHVATQAHGRVRVERPALAHPDLQVGAADVLHDDEAPRPFFEEVEHRDDVGVGEAAHRLDLAPHPLARHVGRRGRRHQQLERDLGVELAVAGEVDDRVAAPTELAADLVAPTEQRARGEIARARRLPRATSSGAHCPTSIRWSTSSALLRQPSGSW